MPNQSINFSFGGDKSKFVAVMRSTQAIGRRVANRMNFNLSAMTVAVGIVLGGAALRGIGCINRLARAAAGAVSFPRTPVRSPG